MAHDSGKMGNPRRLVAIIALALSSLTSAINPWEVLNANDFVLSETSYTNQIAALDAALPIVSVDGIIADVNHNLTAGANEDAYKWPSDPSFDDFGTSQWYPQGISTSADALASGVYGNSRVMLTSWYSKGSKGVRVSFIDTSTEPPWGYRHVLLVEPVEPINTRKARQLSGPTFTTVNVHAGGVAWYGNILYVVDTTGGLRLFDMDHIYRVDDSSKSANHIGRQKKGVYQAYGYKYVLPQCRRYLSLQRPASLPFNFSYVSLDRSTTPDSLVVGEYSLNTTARLARFDLDYTTRLLKTDSSTGEATATEAYRHGYKSVQGTASIFGTYYMTQSHGQKKRGDLLEYTKGPACQNQDRKRVRRGTCSATNDKGHYPAGPEDLTIDRNSGLMWTLTEYPNNRYIIPTRVFETG